MTTRVDRETPFQRIKRRLAEWDSASAQDRAYTAYSRTATILADLRYLVGQMDAVLTKQDEKEGDHDK